MANAYEEGARRSLQGTLELHFTLHTSGDSLYQIYNLAPDVVQEYVQFGEVFNLLHAGASILRAHQNGFGAVGVSTKYGKRSYARYPIFWSLSGIGALPNPDPSDLADWKPGDQPVSSDEVTVNAEFEAGRGALREEAQKWANLNVDASAELFVFVGRWSMQKGVDLIADIFPTILEKHPKTQLICVGPVIDLYGKFAAIKLAAMMEKYPGRVYSNPKFTALPPYIFSGAEFALIPSRDEPFGLVAVEFGRKGAIGVGARVGGLGQMPGWWYTIESTSTSHLLHQFRGAIEGALASATEVRAILRARSSRQRFPVAQWVHQLEQLQSTAIKQHQKYGKKRKSMHLGLGIRSASHSATSSVDTGRGLGLSLGAPPVPPPPTFTGHAITSRNAFRSGTGGAPTPTGAATPLGPTRPGTPTSPEIRTTPASPVLSSLRDDSSGSQVPGMGTRMGPGHEPASDPADTDRDSIISGLEYYLDEDSIGRAIGGPNDNTFWQSPLAALSDTPSGIELQENFGYDQSRPQTPELLPPSSPWVPSDTGLPSPPVSSYQRTNRLGPDGGFLRPAMQAMNSSRLSVDVVVGEKKDFSLQKVDPFFTDPEQDYETAFSRQLANLNGKNTYDTTIEKFIMKSEKDWFNRLRGAKMGKTSTPVGSIFQGKTGHTPAASVYGDDGDDDDQMRTQFLLADDYKPPTGVRKLLLHRLGEWPLYSLLLAFVSHFVLCHG